MPEVIKYRALCTQVQVSVLDIIEYEIVSMKTKIKEFEDHMLKDDGELGKMYQKYNQTLRMEYIGAYLKLKQQYEST